MDDAQTDALAKPRAQRILDILADEQDGDALCNAAGDDHWMLLANPARKEVLTVGDVRQLCKAALASPRAPEPSGKLCCATLTIQGDSYICNLPLEHGGEHHGEHADPAHDILWDDHREWPRRQALTPHLLTFAHDAASLIARIAAVAPEGVSEREAVAWCEKYGIRAVDGAGLLGVLRGMVQSSPSLADKIERLADRVRDGIASDDRQTRAEYDDACAALNELEALALASPSLASFDPSPLGDEDTLRKIMESPEARSNEWVVHAILDAGFGTHDELRAKMRSLSGQNDYLHAANRVLRYESPRATGSDAKVVAKLAHCLRLALPWVKGQDAVTFTQGAADALTMKICAALDAYAFDHPEFDEESSPSLASVPVGEYTCDIHAPFGSKTACCTAALWNPTPTSLASATAGEPTNFNSGEHRPWDGARLNASEAVVSEAMREYKNCALQDGHIFGPDAKETLRRICNVELAKWREEWYDASVAPSVPESPSLESLLGNPRIIDALGALENARHALNKAPADALATCNWIDAQSRLVRDVARVALGESPAPVPEPSTDAARIEKLGALARECAVTLCYYPEADGGPIYSVIHRKIRDGATLCEAIDATEHGS